MTVPNKSCKECREHMADLLLDPAAVPAAVQAHAAACPACGEELTSLRATMTSLDAWEAPEPSAYFDTRLHARLREAQAAPPEGLLEKMRAFLTYSTGRHLRPAMTAALALVLVAGGGSFAGLHGHRNQPQTSATVNDLKILDNNAQAFQEMDQLLDDSNDDDSAPTT